MKPIGMPAYRPTADCIWNSFRSSGKRHLLLTGARKSGKTTLLAALCPQPLPGITTWAEPRKAVYLKENRTGETVRIGVYDDALPGSENKMVLSPDGFVNLGISALERCLRDEGEWISVDEIGYLESGCRQYRDALLQVMEQKRLIAAVRKQDLPFLCQLCRREDVFLLDLDAPFGNAGCVIMASGMGKRFGGNKLMADFHGTPLICRALDATEGIFARRVVVTRYRDVQELCRERGIETVLHDLPGRNDTVRLGLEALGNRDSCLFCPGDQPLLRRETVAALVLAGENDPKSIWRACCGDAVGAPVLFPRWAFAQLHSLPEGNGGGYVAKKYPERVRTVPIRDMLELKDADTPEDLAFLRER